MKNAIATISILLCAIMTGAQAPQNAARSQSLLSLQAEIEALKAPKVAWRAIAWKRCLLDGLKEARATGKPALLWIFIDRPVDDARC